MQKRSFTPEYKAKVVLEILKEEKLIGEIAKEHELNVKILYGWKKEFLENIGRVFGETKKEKEAKNKEKEREQERKELMAKLGELTIENDWLKKKSIELFGGK